MGRVDLFKPFAVSPRGRETVSSSFRKLGECRSLSVRFSFTHTPSKNTETVLHLCDDKLRGVAEAFSRHLHAKKLRASVAATNLAVNPAASHDRSDVPKLSCALVRREQKRALTMAKKTKRGGLQPS